MKPGAYKLWGSTEFNSCTQPHLAARVDGEVPPGGHADVRVAHGVRLAVTEPRVERVPVRREEVADGLQAPHLELLRAPHHHRGVVVQVVT